jgi:hypothetical protein
MKKMAVHKAETEGPSAKGAAACLQGLETLPRQPFCAELLESAKGAAASLQGLETLPRQPFCAGLLETCILFDRGFRVLRRTDLHLPRAGFGV